MLTCTLNPRTQALIYARDMRWRVFPVSGKEPFKGTRGFMDATLSVAHIDWWWNRQYPDANVGIATGKESDLVVLDVDPKNGGDIINLETAVGFSLPRTWTVSTGGGGVHYYFKSPQDAFGDRLVVRNAQGFQGVRGIDVRGDGGFVVAPPSIHASGNVYLFDADTLHSPMAVWPRFPEWKPREVVDENEKFPEGTRQSNLVRLAGAMRRYGADLDSILVALHSTNSNRCVPVLTDREVDEIARRVYNTYAPKFQQPTYSAGRGAGGDIGDSSNEGRRPDEGGVLESRALRGASQQRNIRSGTWYLGRGR